MVLNSKPLTAVGRGSGAFLLSALLASCTSAPAEPLEIVSLVAHTETRRDLDAAALQAARDLRGDLVFAFDVPQDRPASEAAFWRTRAIAWAPAVRQATRAWRAASRGQSAAGQPLPIEVGADLVDLADPDRGGQVQARLDLLGLLGIGPRATEAELARTATLASAARLEAAVWRAGFVAERAFVRLRAALARQAILESQVEEAKRRLRRVELLDELGRTGGGVLERARSVIAGLERERMTRAAEVVGARQALAAASGMHPDAPSLLKVTAFDEAASLAASEDLPQATAAALLRALPELRSARLEYAVAEVAVRHEAAQQWPQLKVGPRFGITPDDLLLGGVLNLGFAWPGVVSARVAAAVENREAARERVEDRLLEALRSVRAQRARLALAHAELEHAHTQEAASRDAWAAACARLQVLEGLEPIETWLDALMLRRRGRLAPIEARERCALLTIDLEESHGPRALGSTEGEA